MKQPAAPFSCTYSSQLPELLHDLGCTIAITTHQAGKLIFISSQGGQKIVQLPRTFDRPMGLAIDGDRLAIATKDEVILLHQSSELAVTYPKQRGTYDGLYLPRATYYTGQIDIHDLHWGHDGLWAVNTSFSCLARMSLSHNWEPCWQPDFISSLASEDRCHLNGLAMSAGSPLYVTALGKGDRPQQWREDLPDGGVIINVKNNNTLLENLPMPHSPRIINETLYCLLSATGELIRVDTEAGTYQVMKKLGGFVRGMAHYKDYLFVGLSRLRQNSSTFQDLPIAEKATHAGLVVLHLPSMAMVAQLKYQTTVDEIYDVQIVPGLKRPGVLNTINDIHKYALSIPGSTYWAQPKGE